MLLPYVWMDDYLNFSFFSAVNLLHERSIHNWRVCCAMWQLDKPRNEEREVEFDRNNSNQSTKTELPETHLLAWFLATHEITDLARGKPDRLLEVARVGERSETTCRIQHRYD
jgi:hypothetical protein